MKTQTEVVNLEENEVVVDRMAHESFKLAAEALVDARGYADAVLAKVNPSRQELIQALKEIRAAINW